MAIFLHGREGVTHRDPLAIVSYGTGVLLLNKILKEVYPDVTQTWYPDDVGALGTFNNIGLHFNLLKQFVPGCGYYPEPHKRVLIVHPDNTKSGK